MEKLLTAKEVAERLSLAPKTVREWLRLGKIPGTVLPDGSMRFSEKIIDSWLEKRTTKAKAYIG